MRIDNSQQMFRQLDNGAHLKVKGDGLVTRSAFSHAMQKVRDAFRHNPAGRAHIERRDNALRDAMARMVAQDADRNPVDNAAHAPVITPEQRNYVATRISVAKAMHKAGIPAEATRLCSRYINSCLQALTERGRLTPEGVPAAANRLASDIAATPLVLDVLKLDFKMNPKVAEARCKVYAQNMQNYVAKDSTRAALLPNGVHPSYNKDARRNMVASLNGGPAVPEGTAPLKGHEEFGNHLVSLLPDQPREMVAMISLLASQGGLLHEMADDEWKGQLFKMASPEALVTGNMRMKAIAQGYDVDIDGNTAVIRMHSHEQLQVYESFGTSFVPRTEDQGPALLDLHFGMEARVDLTQDMSGKKAPDISIGNFSLRTSVPD